MPPENVVSDIDGKVLARSLADRSSQNSRQRSHASLISSVPSSSQPLLESSMFGGDEITAANEPGIYCEGSDMLENEDNLGGETPQDVFRASINFENSSPAIPLPFNSDRRSSSSSLYPTIESVVEAGTMDNDEFEECWKRSVISPSKQRSVIGCGDKPTQYGEYAAARIAPLEGSIQASVLATGSQSRSEELEEDFKNASKSISPVAKTSEDDRLIQAVASLQVQSSIPVLGSDRLSDPSAREQVSSAAASDNLIHSAFSSDAAYATIPCEDDDTDDDLVALKRAAYEGYDIGSIAVAGMHDQEAQATVVDYNVHPSEIDFDAVQAEFIGQDFYSSISVPSIATSSNHFAAAASSSEDALHIVNDMTDDDGETTAEATVIESAPIEKAASESWVSQIAEEAQVLDDNTNVQVFDLDSKPPAMPNPQPWVSREESGGDSMAFADEEAEVVGITELIHPSEFNEDGARAELIGSDFNCAVAIHHEQSDEILENGIVEEATVVANEESQPTALELLAPESESYASPTEVQAAVLVDGSTVGNHDFHSSEAVTPVTTVFEGTFGSQFNSDRFPSFGVEDCVVISPLSAN